MTLQSLPALPWPAIAPERLCPQVLLAGFYVMQPPTTPRYRVRGLHYCLVTGGTMRFAHPQGGTGVAGPGELVWFGAGVNQYEVDRAGPLSLYQLHWHAGVDALADGVPTLPEQGALPRALALGDHLAAAIAQWDRLIQSVLQASPTWRIESASAALEIQRLAFEAAFRRRRRPALRLNPWEKLLARLEEQERMPRVSELAREFGLSTEAFIRSFRRYTGNTPKQYLLQRRLWKGRRLLQGGASAKHAARAAGFADPLYFSRCYRRLFGHPPSLTRAHDDQAAPDCNTSLPISRHVFAPGVEMGYFSA
jgi:AraC-like DNA-binding protein